MLHGIGGKLRHDRLADGLAVRGPQPQIDLLVAEVIGEGIALRALSRRETPLEAFFFMLTEPELDTPDLAGASR